MEPRREVILQELLETAEVLPSEQLREVFDFASFLNAKRAAAPQRGSAEALLKHAGGFVFESGELEDIMADIDHLRSLELESDA